VSDNLELEKRLTRQDVIKGWLYWTFFSHSNYNYERLQATAFAHSMIPAIKRLYGDDPEETKAALKRHLIFFNTAPDIGSVIHGAVYAMEEQRANGRPVTEDAINSTKVGLMGPLAGIGDTITQGILVPILLAVAIGLTGLDAATGGVSGSGNPWGAIMFIVFMLVWHVGVHYVAFTQGYKQGRSLATSLFKSGLLDKVVVGASVLGNMVLGALSASFVVVYVGLRIEAEGTTLALQTDVFDKLLPGLLPLVTVLLCWWLLQRGMHPITLLVIIIVVSFIGAYPFFGPEPMWVTDACGSSIFQPYASCVYPAAG